VSQSDSPGRNPVNGLEAINGKNAIREIKGADTTSIHYEFQLYPLLGLI